MSAFTDVIRLMWDGYSGNVNGMVKGEMTETYILNSATKIDAEKARAIFHNTHNSYKLSAGMIKPIINADTSFIGEPVFSSEDNRTQERLDIINKENVGFFMSAHKVALREGSYYIWAQWDDEDNKLIWVGIPDDKVKDIIRDPVTNKIIQYVLEWHISYKDKPLNTKQMTILVYIDKEEITYKYTGDVPAKYQNETVRNVLGIIPIVQLSNEQEDFEVKGHSEITAVEPYLKAYHDVLMMALQAQKNNSAPKLKIKTASFQKFIDNNFGTGTYSKWLAGTLTEGVDLKDLDLLLLGEKDEADYVTVQSTTGSAQPLLEILFYLIVETSETIEVVFGANLGTSLASVEAQLPVYVKKIKRKQTQFEKAWKKLIEVTLIIDNFVNIQTTSNLDINIEWQVVDFETAKEKAETLKTLAETYANGLKNRLLSLREAHEESKKIFDSVEENYEKHSAEIAETAMLLNKFEEDAMSQAIDFEEETTQVEEDTELRDESLNDGGADIDNQSGNVTLNGAQIKAALDILNQVGEGIITKSTAVQVFIIMFNMTEEQANKLLQDIEEGVITMPEEDEEEDGAE